MDAKWVRSRRFQRASRAVSIGGGELGAMGRAWLWAASCGWAVSVLTHMLYSFIFHASFSGLPDL